MPRLRHTVEQVLGKLREAEVALSKGQPVAQVCRTVGITELRKQLQIMESGKAGKDRLPGDRLRPAITSVPALALEYGRLTRDLKVQETLYALLVSQYEQAKLTEARDTPTVQVLDPAVPVERKSRPKISLNLLIAGILSMLIAIFWAFVREALDRRKAQLSPHPSFS